MKKVIRLAAAVGLLALPVSSAHAAAPSTGLQVEGATLSFANNDPAGATRYRENGSDLDINQQREMRWSLQDMVGINGGIPADGDHIDTAIIDAAGNVVFYNFLNDGQAIVHGDAARLDMRTAKGQTVGNLDGQAVMTMFDNELGDTVGLGFLGV
jgi:hypothetical protein